GIAQPGPAHGAEAEYGLRAARPGHGRPRRGPRRDGPGIHGRDHRARLPGPRPDRRTHARAARRSAPESVRPQPGSRRPCFPGATMPAVLTPPAATTLAHADPGRAYALTEPTLGSAWQAVTGTTIGDELLEWPPDL